MFCTRSCASIQGEGTKVLLVRQDMAITIVGYHGYFHFLRAVEGLEPSVRELVLLYLFFWYNTNKFESY